ncbi:MAG TPA: hypothetical protein VK668_21945 [Mucilaginibacter sp.]|nr:hypothetical protein [Mucilaginibacter sp.]
MKLSETGRGSEAVRQAQQQCGNGNHEAVMQTGDRRTGTESRKFKKRRDRVGNTV